VQAESAERRLTQIEAEPGMPGSTIRDRKYHFPARLQAGHADTATDRVLGAGGYHVFLVEPATVRHLPALELVGVEAGPDEFVLAFINCPGWQAE
jgi:hypothetical protein